MPMLDVTVPDNIGDAEECVVVTWLKREHDAVQKDDVLVILQAAKVSFELAAPASGRVAAILAQQGEVVRENQVIARLEAAIEQIAPAPPPPPAAPRGEIRASPIAKRLAKEQGIDLALVSGSGEEGRISEKDVLAFIAARQTAPPVAEAPQEVRASPIAKRLAREHNIDLAQVKGSGDGGRITEKDVQEYIAARTATAPASALSSPPATITAIPFSPMRATIARRMRESLQNTAQLTMTAQVDVTALVKRREALKADFDLSYTDLLVKAVTLALVEHPRLNAWVVGEELRLVAEKHIGVAVALDEGLIVPVIRRAEGKTLRQIAQETQELAQRARSNSLSAAEVTGSTFTITNLGMYGITTFTPILNPPEVAILGVGRIDEKLTRREGDLLWRKMLTLSLTFDHRVIDGAPAALFLQSLRQQLEAPTWANSQ